MNTALALTVGMARSWVVLYTRGMPAELREARRREIDSDLWEQQWLAARRGDPVFGTAIEVLARMLLGVISDITWRVEVGASAHSKGITSMKETFPMRIGFLAAILPLGFLAVMGTTFLLGNGDFENTWEHWIWRILFVACPLIGGFGLWLCATRPGLGMALVLVGVGASAFLMPWMAFVTVPFGIAIIIFAFFRARGAGWPRRAGTGLPTGTGTA